MHSNYIHPNFFIPVVCTANSMLAYLQGQQPRQPTSGIVTGVQRTLVDDFQHGCLELDWIRLSFVVLMVYASIAFGFAVGFYSLGMLNWTVHFVGDSCFENPFEEFWWMSVGHLVTSGYGHVLPASWTSFSLITAEQVIGILLSALLLGIVVTKARLPTSRIVFSDKLLFTSRNGMPIVLFRMGNARGNVLLCPEVRVSYFKPVTTVEGEQIWMAKKLEFEEPPSLGPVFNLAHRVTKSSPFHGLTEDQIREEGGRWWIVLRGTDEHSLETLHAQKAYTVENVEFNQIFGNVLLVTPTGDRTVDFRKLNATMPAKGSRNWCSSSSETNLTSINE